MIVTIRFRWINDVVAFAAGADGSHVQNGTAGGCCEAGPAGAGVGVGRCSWV